MIELVAVSQGQVNDVRLQAKSHRHLRSNIEIGLGHFICRHTRLEVVKQLTKGRGQTVLLDFRWRLRQRDGANLFSGHHVHDFLYLNFHEKFSFAFYLFPHGTTGRKARGKRRLWGILNQLGCSKF
ncbi:hypothetical protein EFT87_09935 [Schleiferilactobacillus harbinensis]|nr:hypothetical protein [Schleiferilactobacillus harbinensis]